MANTKRFDGGEGIDLSGNNIVFTTKGDNRVWSYNPGANTLTVIYDAAVHVNGVLFGCGQSGDILTGCHLCL